MPTLEGKIVRLVPLQLVHAGALLAAAGEDRSTYGFTVVPADAAQMRAYIQQGLDQADRGESMPFATVDARTGRVVGTTWYLNLQRWHGAFEPAPSKASPPSVLEIGSTWLAASAQRTAINTEAKLLMLRQAFEVWKVLRVTLKTDVRNMKSRAAILRLGAKEDGVLRAWQLAADGGPRDTAFYSILLSEWPAVRARLER
jgi:N-acetyltransferase